MNARTGKTCQYCEWWRDFRCPYEILRDIRPITIDTPACGQFFLLRNVSKFKERKALEETVSIKKQKAVPDKKLKRNLEF